MSGIIPAMKPLSIDIRERIVAAYGAGNATREGVARRFDVSLGLVKKLLAQKKKLGHVRPLYENVGRKPAIGDDARKAISAAVAEDPGITLSEIRRKFRLKCSIVTVHATLASMGLTYKKRRSARRSRGAKTWQKRGGTGLRDGTPGTHLNSCSSTSRASRRR